jgi:hypothetical protein
VGGTIGFSPTPDALRTEADHNTQPHTPYFIGKIAAEKEAFAIGEREKLPVTAINPGFILGPRFWKLSESTRQVVDYLNNGIPVYFDGGFGVVDVEDVANGALLAMDKGADRERYIVSGENVTVKQLFQHISELTGISAPQWKVPVPVLRVIATGLEAVSWVTGWRPMLDRSQVDEFAGASGTSIRARRSGSSASPGAARTTPSGARSPGRSTGASFRRRGSARCNRIRRCRTPTDGRVRDSDDGAEPVRVAVPREPLSHVPVAARPRAPLPQRFDELLDSRASAMYWAFLDWQTYSSVGGLI